MFKTGYLASWFKKTPSSEKAVSSEPVNTSFAVPGNEPSSVFHVYLLEASEDFVDINYRKLSYAEAAAKGKLKPQSSRITKAKPAHPRVQHNQYDVLQEKFDRDYDEDFTESVYLEPLHKDNFFLKNKVMKEADKEKNIKSKQKKALKKMQ